MRADEQRQAALAPPDETRTEIPVHQAATVEILQRIGEARERCSRIRPLEQRGPVAERPVVADPRAGAILRLERDQLDVGGDPREGPRRLATGEQQRRGQSLERTVRARGGIGQLSPERPAHVATLSQAQERFVLEARAGRRSSYALHRELNRTMEAEASPGEWRPQWELNPCYRRERPVS